MSRSEFDFLYGLRPIESRRFTLNNSLAEYNDNRVVFNAFLAGTVENRAGCLTKPSLNDYVEVWELWQMSRQDFDLTTMYRKSATQQMR